MTAPPRPPQFNPAPGFTLGEIKDRLAEEAYRIEREVRRAAMAMEYEEVPAEQARRYLALDWARKIIEALEPRWDEHKALMSRARSRF